MNRDQRQPSLKLNAALNSVCAVMSIIFPLITYPYVTRLLQAENLGKVNFASSTIGYFSLIAGLGITQYASREGVQYRDNQKKLNQFGSELFSLSLLTTIFSLLLLGISVLLVPKLGSYKYLLAIYSTTIAMSPFEVGWLYRLEEDYLYITVRSIIIQFISFALLFILVRSPEDYYKYAALNAFSNVGANVFNFAYSKKYITLNIGKNIKKSLRHLKKSIIFFSSSIASSIYSNIDMTMLGFFSTDYNIGIYSASVKMYGMIKTILTAVTSVMTPRLTFFKSHDMEEEFNHLISKVFKIMLTLLLPIVVGLILVAHETVVVLCGNSYEEASTSLRILSCAIFFAMLGSIINGCVLIPSKLERKALRTTVSAALVNLILNFIAIPLFQQNGAAATTVLAEMTVLMVGWHYARNLIKLENLKNTIITSTIGCIIMICISICVDLLFDNAILLLVIKILLCAICYGICLILLKNEIAIEYSRWLIDRVKSHQRRMK